jgi:hypothetical protein
MESKTYKIRQMFSMPIQMDTQNFNYYLRLLTVQFSNMVPNVGEKEGIAVGGVDTDVIQMGMWSLDQMITQWNTLSIGTLAMNANTGKITLTNDTGSSITYSNPSYGRNILVDYLGFSASQFPATIANNGTLVAPETGNVSSYNYFILSSTNISGYTYISRDGRGGTSTFLPSSCIYAFSSAIDAFKFKSWTAVQPVQFKLDGDKLNYLEFELRTGQDEEIKFQLGQSDFMVACQLVRERKL